MIVTQLLMQSAMVSPTSPIYDVDFALQTEPEKPEPSGLEWNSTDAGSVASRE